MSAHPDHHDLAALAGQALLAAGLKCVTAESCTGGGVAAALTDIPGSSQWFERGFVTYSNESKIQDLGVDPAALERHGAVSTVVAEQMVAGALQRSGADLAVAVSGIAGPDGGSLEKPVGLVYLAVGRRGGAVSVRRELFAGDRAAVRSGAVRSALRLLTQAAGGGSISAST